MYRVYAPYTGIEQVIYTALIPFTSENRNGRKNPLASLNGFSDKSMKGGL